MYRRTSLASSSRLAPYAPRAARARLRRAERARQIIRRREGRRRGVNATGQPRRDLLEQPAVAVRIIERGERAVAAKLRIRTADPEPPKQVGLVLTGVNPAGVVENLADLDAAGEQLVAGGSDVGDDQVQSLGEPGAEAVTFLPKMTEHPEPGGVNWITRKSSPLS